MRKYQADVHASGPRPSRPGLPALILFVAAALASPLLYEGALLLAANWRTMSGTYSVASTPILDTLAEWWRTARVDANRHAYRVFSGGTWDSKLLVPFAVGWAAVMAVVFLRKTH